MIGAIKRVKLNQLCFPYARKLSGLSADITGNPFRAPSEKAAWALDESLIDILSGNKDARPMLKGIVQEDANANFCKILILFESLRYNLDYRTANIASTLVEIDGLLADGKLSRREGYYAAAALAWYEGNYMKSGMLLETSLVNTRADLVAVRLAQDAYIAAGSSSNVLNSVIRHPSTSETPAHLQGHLLGMISKGYVETGQMKQAEDESERAVEATKGQSSLALHTLLNCYQIQGRSSEINAKLEEFVSKHEGNGLSNLLYSRGSAHIMRGNYSGAYKVVEELVEMLEGQYKLGENSHSSVVWSHAVLLLWNLCLNTSDLNDVVFTPIWRVLGKYESESVPLHDLCSSMVLASLANAKTAAPRSPPAPPAIPATTNGEEPVKTGKQEAQGSGGLRGIWQTLTGSAKFKSKQSYTAGEANPDVENFQNIAKHIRTRFQVSEYKELGEKTDYKELYEAHIRKLQAPRAASLACPKLRSILPNANLVRSTRVGLVLPQSSASPHLADLSDLSSLSDQEYSRREFVLPFSVAVSQFAQEQYGAANEAFLQRAPQGNLLGGTAVQRDIVRQMGVESAFRANNIEMAFFMLRERSVLVPNDAQCWRRLASIYGNSGQRELATRAHYTAWTLGIEQGGFGGMR